MNKNQIKGSAKQAAGKIQKKAGQILGNPAQEAKGLAKEIAGGTQKLAGDVKEQIKDAGAKR